MIMRMRLLIVMVRKTNSIKANDYGTLCQASHVH